MNNGLCQCGCGKTTPIIKKSCKTRGMVRGEHYRFVMGHGCRVKDKAAAFWRMVDRRGEDKCWPWKAAAYRGYGMFLYENRVWRTNRLAWVLTFGAITDDKHVLHHCDNPGCCNPNHLFLGTNNDNIADRVAKGRSTRGEQDGMAKITEKQALEIRQRYAEEKITHKDLASEYHISPTQVGRIVRRERWSWLD